MIGVSTSAQIALHVTQEHFRLTELALAFQTAPADIMPAPAAELMTVALMTSHEISDATTERVPASAPIDVADAEPIGMPWAGIQRTASTP